MARSVALAKMMAQLSGRISMLYNWLGLFHSTDPGLSEATTKEPSQNNEIQSADKFKERDRKDSPISSSSRGRRIVLNASEQGLAFHAAAVVRHPAHSALRFTQSLQRMEVMAELVDG